MRIVHIIISTLLIGIGVVVTRKLKARGEMANTISRDNLKNDIVKLWVIIATIFSEAVAHGFLDIVLMILRPN